MTKVPFRGRLSKNFATALSSKGNIAPIIEYILNDTELDVQVRDNYINVYYKGGNILRIKPQSFSFDKYYFYLGHPKGFPKSYVMKVADGKSSEISPRATEPIPSFNEALEIVSELDTSLHDIMNLLPENPTAFFKKAKTTMDSWFEKNPKSERLDQQKITSNNREFSDNNNLVVIDIEFAVSKNKAYNLAVNKKGNGKVCRFDIIAVDKNGQLYIIELKQNQSADEEGKPANVADHIKDFNATVGKDKNGEFAQEMLQVVKTKQMLGTLPKDIKVDTKSAPIFAVAYSGEDADTFNAKYRKAGVTVVEVDKDTRKLNK